MTVPSSTPGARPLVLVTGSGRSGTSSLAGSLSKLGLHVPPPLLTARDMNPKGMFETAWVVEFHADLLRRAMVRSSDGSPHALHRVASTLAGSDAAQVLQAWLAGQDAPLLAVKDNQACWFVDLWRDAATSQGRDLRLLTSLRHPAEVVGSRDRVWGEGRTETDRRSRETTNVAAWLNGVLITERSGRGSPRAFVAYTELLADWRGELGRVSAQLGLALPVPAPGQPHELDEWLDAGLRRSQLTWADLEVPPALRELAEEAWQAVHALVADPADGASVAVLDQVGDRYADLYAEAVALARDESRHLQKAAAQRSAAKIRGRLRSLKRRVRAAEERLDDPPPVGLVDRARRALGRQST